MLKVLFTVTMTSRSVDSVVGKLRAIFRDLWRTGEGSDITQDGNSALSMVFKRHIKVLQVDRHRMKFRLKKLFL